MPSTRIAGPNTLARFLTAMASSRARAVACAIALGLFAGPVPGSERPYAFGVFPYLPLTKIHDLYAPMAQSFEAKLGRPVQLGSKAAYGAFSEDLRRQTYDIAFVQPFDYIEAHDRHGYLPLARRAGYLEAIIVVRRDSPFRSIEDLRGKTLANPPADAAVSQVTTMALWEAGINPSAEVVRSFGRNHFTCLQSVLIGVADACGTAEQPLRTLENGEPSSRFRVLHKTVRIPHALFVVHKRVSRKHREALQKTIVDWSRTEEGKKILERGQFVPFVAAHDAEYEVVRQYVRGTK
jgi:phosphonate transport system substrate-binding protein